MKNTVFNLITHKQKYHTLFLTLLMYLYKNNNNHQSMKWGASFIENSYPIRNRKEKKIFKYGSIPPPIKNVPIK